MFGIIRYVTGITESIIGGVVGPVVGITVVTIPETLGITKEMALGNRSIRVVNRMRKSLNSTNRNDSF